LGPNVEVGLISYSGGCSPGGRVVQELTTDKDVVVTAIQGLSPGGGTPMAPAINFARNYLEQNAKSRAGQMIVLSDGQNDCGSVSDAGDGLARSSMNIKLDAVGLGLADGSQADQDLQDLVRSSGGTQYSASNSEELVRAFRRASVFDQVKWDDPYVDPTVRASLQNLFQLAAAHLKNNDFAAASAAFKSAVDQHPNSPAAHHNYSLALEADGQLVGAIQEGEKYLQLAPNAFDAGSVRARIDQLRREVAENPRAIFSPHLCNDLYQWARAESNRVRDASRKAAAFRIMTAAQRGDCELATREYEAYTNQ
jgi:tetratricopeptide (TPR) repeat protein